jgi:hypothetical protein
VGDRLTEYYVRRAAGAAKLLPPEVAPNAFLLALGNALGDPQALAENQATASLLGAFETPRERTMRRAMLGDPTIHGRRDLAQHFFVSALLTAAAGGTAAEAAGVSKELLDAQGESGFSFADLAADRAGIQFARRVIDKRLTLPMMAQAFSVPGFVPAVKDLPEKLTAAEFTKQFSGPDDDRFQRQLQVIDQRILQLPAYRSVGPGLRP